MTDTPTADERISDPRPTVAAGGDALFTDLYELSMLQAYFAEGMDREAVFSLYVRTLPARRNYLIACGLESVLEQLENLRFSAADIAYLEGLDMFTADFLDWLRDFRFTGSVRAVAEGTPMFGEEPILEVTASLPEAQLVETLVMNQVHLQTVLASKARRVVDAAEGRTVLDFGARRMHGLDAAVQGARAFHIAGVAGTSNVRAGARYGIPVAGTMAHSYVQAHADETEAFAAFLRVFPDTVLLVDTYDTLAAVDRIIALARDRGGDIGLRAVRLDSGDLVALSRAVRRRLDDAGLQRVQILASGGLEEDGIARLIADGAALDGFGVGTAMAVSEDAPSLDLVYKLCAYGGEGRMKLSTGKAVLPGAKQVFRSGDAGGDHHDVIARADETLSGRPLLETVMRDGHRIRPAPALADIRSHVATQLARLPAALRAPQPAETPYPVAISEALDAYRTAVSGTITAAAGVEGRTLPQGGLS